MNSKPEAECIKLLEIRSNDARTAIKGKGGIVEPVLLYKGKPMLKFGPMSETSTFAYKLGSSAYDVKRWAKWQKDHGMGYVRCYPEQGYGWVDTRPEGRLYPFKQVKPLIFDLDAFDSEYWENFREVGRCLRENDVVIHLQLVQVCYFKGWAPEARRWHCCYWNPTNNVNEWTKELKSDFPFTDKNSSVLAHWKRYVEAVLDAVGDLGNVILDLGNELHGQDEWVDWNLEIIAEWEREHGCSIIKGLDYTHMDNAVKVLDDPRFDVIITHGEFIDDAPLLRRLFGKPVVSVISRDSGYTGNGRSGYLGLGEYQSNEDRFRWFHYRCMMNKVQGVGDYGKMMGGQEQKRTGDLEYSIVDPSSDRVKKFARESAILGNFYDSIKDYEKLSLNHWILAGTPAGVKSYCLKSEKEMVVYLVRCGCEEITDGCADGRILKLKVLSREDGEFYARAGKAHVMHPAAGEMEENPLRLIKPKTSSADESESISIKLPAFKDDLIIHIYEE